MRALKVHVQLQVSIDGPAETAVRRGPLEQRAYSFAYSTKTPGTYVISATAAGGHMDGSPATVTASIAEAHAPLCEVVGTPLRISTVAGTPDLHARAETLERLCIHDRIPTACLPLCQAAKITLLTESTAGQL